jgi:hypothetical protein
MPVLAVRCSFARVRLRLTNAYAANMSGAPEVPHVAILVVQRASRQKWHPTPAVHTVSEKRLNPRAICSADLNCRSIKRGAAGE